MAVTTKFNNLLYAKGASIDANYGPWASIKEYETWLGQGYGVLPIDGVTIAVKGADGSISKYVREKNLWRSESGIVGFDDNDEEHYDINVNESFRSRLEVLERSFASFAETRYMGVFVNVESLKRYFDEKFWDGEKYANRSGVWCVYIGDSTVINNLKVVPGALVTFMFTDKATWDEVLTGLFVQGTSDMMYLRVTPEVLMLMHNIGDVNIISNTSYSVECE